MFGEAAEGLVGGGAGEFFAAVVAAGGDEEDAARAFSAAAKGQVVAVEVNESRARRGAVARRVQVLTTSFVPPMTRLLRPEDGHDAGEHETASSRRDRGKCAASKSLGVGFSRITKRPKRTKKIVPPTADHTSSPYKITRHSPGPPAPQSFD